MKDKSEHIPSVTSDDGRLGDARPDDERSGENTAQVMVDLDTILRPVRQSLATATNASVIENIYSDMQSPVEQMRVMVFQLGPAYYAFEIHHVREIVRHAMITRVPTLPDWVLGVFNFHGDITSVVDLAGFWQVAAEPLDPANRAIIVAQAVGQQIGLMVSRVRRISAFPVETLIAQPVRGEPAITPYVRGIFDAGDYLIRLLDSERLLLGTEMQQFGG